RGEAAATLARPLRGGREAVDARLAVADLEAELETDFLPEDDDSEIDTVGGLIFMLAGRVPAIGEVIEHPSGYRFEIVDGEPRRITRVRVYPRPQPQAEACPCRHPPPGPGPLPRP